MISGLIDVNCALNIGTNTSKKSCNNVSFIHNGPICKSIVIMYFGCSARGGDKSYPVIKSQ